LLQNEGIKKSNSSDNNLILKKTVSIRKTTGGPSKSKAIEELINEGFLLAKKSTNEIHVSLNPEKKKEIYTFIGIKEN